MEKKPRPFRQALTSLQFRATMLMACVVLAATGLTGAMYLRASARLTLTEAKSHAKNLARSLAAATSEAVTEGDRDRLTATAEGIATEGGLSYIIFTDVTGRFLAGYQRGVGNVTPFVLEDGGAMSVEPIDRPALHQRPGGEPVVDIVYPISTMEGPTTEDHHASTAGFVRLGANLGESYSRLVAVNRSAFFLAVSVALLMVPIGFEAVRRMLNPVNQLTEAANKFAGGNWDVRVKVHRRDELGALAGTFNGMADEITTAHNRLVKLNAELEDRVLQRTTALERANRRLREMAARDSLTGLYNRRHFDDILSQLFAEASRYDSELTCMMIDLDNFKRVNDTLGHHTGDRLLQITADVIRASIREADVAIRYGGDEFAILLPHTSPNEARVSAVRMLERFRDELTRHLPQAAITSLSIGLASREADEPATPQELVNLADEALYLAKAAGKNRITVLRPAAASTQSPPNAPARRAAQ